MQRHLRHFESKKELQKTVGILVIEGLVLFGVQYFQQRRGWVASNVCTRFVNLVQQHYRIVDSHPLIVVANSKELIKECMQARDLHVA